LKVHRPIELSDCRINAKSGVKEVGVSFKLYEVLQFFKQPLKDLFLEKCESLCASELKIWFCSSSLRFGKTKSVSNTSSIRSHFLNDPVWTNDISSVRVAASRRYDCHHQTRGTKVVRLVHHHTSRRRGRQLVRLDHSHNDGAGYV
jgi:hypothetical protein